MEDNQTSLGLDILDASCVAAYAFEDSQDFYEQQYQTDES